MLIRTTMLALLLGTSLLTAASAQVVSPLGGSTSNPQSAPPATRGPAPRARAATPTTAAPATASPAATAARPARVHRTLAERFAAANTTHDGKLTVEQARAGHLRAVVRDFAMIDKNKTGSVTLDQIKAHQTAQRAAHRAARATAKPASAKPATPE